MEDFSRRYSVQKSDFSTDGFINILYVDGVIVAADLNEKVERYERLLREALGKADISPIERSHMRKVAEDYKNMARSYYEDGMHFIRSEDSVNALICFSYGHAWLDAGARLGVFDVDDDVLFTI